jgi:general secretion pathway protein M
MNKLKAWYAGLQTREQRVVGIGAAVLGALILFAGIVWPLESAVSSAVKTRETRTDDLAWMRINAPEIQAGSATVSANTGEAPVVLVDRVGREAGLGNALRGTQPSGAGVRVQLEAAPFDTLVTWLASLDERYGLAIESISVDRAAKPGVVNANITFAPSKH